MSFLITGQKHWQGVNALSISLIAVFAVIYAMQIRDILNGSIHNRRSGAGERDEQLQCVEAAVDDLPFLNCFLKK